MHRGMFYRITDQDLLELFFQQFGPKMAFRGGPAVMQQQADKVLSSVTIFMTDYPDQTDAADIMLELVFRGEGDSARVDGRLMQATARDVDDYLLDTVEALAKSREQAAGGDTA